ncbi:MAG: HesA/MoeB/ThiF family protein [Gammaproteobacteria bacterium]|nr:HesA/MoeB/ThiF family protein [Gammaproteobacteria bacterium]
MEDEQLARYSRHLLLPQIDLEGQQRLLDSHALIIGLGGLGSPAALYLAASGVGRITLSDPDHIELSNLQRQILYRTQNIGYSKTASALTHLQQLNPDVSLSPINHKLSAPELAELLPDIDVVIDASDNFPSRYLINKACVMSDTALVTGAAIGLNGQITVINPQAKNFACYHCLYPDATENHAESCSDHGVFSPLLGIIGSIQACEALKILADFGTTLGNRLLQINAQTMSIKCTPFSREPTCPTCS